MNQTLFNKLAITLTLLILAPSTQNLSAEAFNPASVFTQLSGKDGTPVIGWKNKTYYAESKAYISGKNLIIESNGIPNYKPNFQGQEIKSSWNDELAGSGDRNPNSIDEQ
tara:strand:+ start:535 stop:864 length:330 start_codon:yes stop_codon:yes gene_type:complete